MYSKLNGIFESKISITFNDLNILLGTAWGKYHQGKFDEACKIAGHILQDPLLQDLQGAPIQFQVMLSEIRMLILHCQISDTPSKQLSIRPLKGIENFQHLPQFRNHGKDVIEHGPLQTALSIVKLTNDLSVYFVSPKCSQELSRVALALRTYTISFKSRELITSLNSWVGLPSEMKMFGTITAELARHLAFSKR